MSHLESADGENTSLEPVVSTLARLGVPVTLVKNIKNARVEIEKLHNGSCLLLENLRLNDGEKENDPQFAKELASLADMYVNDAFSVSHREHASVVGVPQHIPGYAGLQLQKEVTYLSKAFTPRHPFLFILGGAKFETKLPLLHKFIDSADMLFVGGALANDLYKQKGYEVGVSLVSKTQIDLSEFISNQKVFVPVDVVTEKKETKPADAVLPIDKILDAGPQTVELLQEKISTAEFILWNGPLGLYEDGYRQPTHELARMIGEATVRGAETIVGGGDTLAAISELGIEQHFSFISTGGGAMLDFLAKGTLPAIEALERS
jgi:phosphoglycerate kinase